MAALIQRHRPLHPHIQSLTRTAFQQTRSLHARVTPQKIPDPTPFVPNASTFLTLIGRSLSQHASKIPSWSALFTLSGSQLRELGVEPARSRRYLLAWRDRFRRGEYGIGGDCLHVDAQGRAELRLVDVPVGSPVERRAWDMKHAGDSLDAQRQGGVSVSSEAKLTRGPGMRRLVVNVPVALGVAVGAPSASAGEEGGEGAVGEAEAEGEGAKEALEQGETQEKAFRELSLEELEDAAPVTGVKILAGHDLVGRFVRPVKGTHGAVATIQVQEGLWEHRRGHKVDGGERRQAEVRAKKRAAARRAAAR